MTDWTTLSPSEKADAIRHVYEPGYSATNLGSVLGTSRCSVMGVYNRLPSLRETHPLRNAANAPTIKKRRADQPFRKPKRLNASPQLTAERVSAPPPISEPSPLNIALADLNSRQCRWPLGDGPFTFCGHAAEGTYCAYHAKMAVGQGSPSERRAERVLRAEML